MDDALKTEMAFPGGKSPRLEWVGTPEKIPPFVDTLKAGSAHASAIMRGDRAPTPPTAQQIERTPAESSLAALLVEQNRLSRDISEEGEAQYQAVCARITALSAAP